jgi:Na+-transporting methylmalonyl-CoA/oxaloacetate decarboxylase gamma subunit
MFLTRLLVLILFLVLARFVVRFVRALLVSAPRRPEVHSGQSQPDDPTRGKRIIDVEFTEDRSENDSGGNPR